MCATEVFKLNHFEIGSNHLGLSWPAELLSESPSQHGCHPPITQIQFPTSFTVYRIHLGVYFLMTNLDKMYCQTSSLKS